MDKYTSTSPFGIKMYFLAQSLQAPLLFDRLNFFHNVYMIKITDKLL